MDKLKLMAAFVAVAEEGGFAAGARRVRMSAPAITRAIAALERTLGAKLLRRTTRKVALTSAGERYLMDARRILVQVSEAEETVGGLQTQVRGRITITAPVLYGKMFVLPLVLDFLRRHPEVEISALFLDRVVNLLDEGVDVGVRIGELADSSMNAIRVGHVRPVVCASPSYLRNRGTPKTLDELRSHQLIAATGVGSSTDWRFMHQDQTATVPINPRLIVTSNEAALEAALAGFAITRLLSYQVAEHVARGRLKLLLEPYALPSVPINIVHQEGRHASARVRLLIDHMALELKRVAALPTDR